LNFDKNSVPLKQDDNNFLMHICGKCNGAGLVVWTCSARGLQENEKDVPIFIPLAISTMPTLETASWMFYTHFLADCFQELDIHFDFNNNHSENSLKEFANYFLQSYLPSRDQLLTGFKVSPK